MPRNYSEREDLQDLQALWTSYCAAQLAKDRPAILRDFRLLCRVIKRLGVHHPTECERPPELLAVEAAQWQSEWSAANESNDEAAFEALDVRARNLTRACARTLPLCELRRYTSWSSPKRSNNNSTGYGGMTGRELTGRKAPLKLTEEQVTEIRALAATGMLPRLIADKYGVSQSMIRNVVNRICWRHVP